MFGDINNLHKALKRHENSQTHIISTMQLVMFGKSRIDCQVDNQKRLTILYREIKKRLIDIIWQLGLRGHEESVDSIDRGNYVELVHLLRKYDHKLNVYPENSTVFTGLSNRVQNDLIHSISDVNFGELIAISLFIRYHCFPNQK